MSKSYELKLENILSDQTSRIKDDFTAASGVVNKANTLDDNIIQRPAAALGRIDDQLKQRTLDSRSIVARAKNSILHFPVYCSNVIRVDTAQIIAGLLERTLATLVQVVIAQQKTLTEEEANNLEFLKQYHVNLREAADAIVNKYYQPIDEFDSMMKDAIFYRTQLSENMIVEFRSIPTVDQNLIMESARLVEDPLAGFAYYAEAPAKVGHSAPRDITRRGMKGRDGMEISTTYKDREISDQDFSNTLRDENRRRVAAGQKETTVEELKQRIRNGDHLKIGNRDVEYVPPMQRRDRNGNPLTDDNGNPIMEPEKFIHPQLQIKDSMPGLSKPVDVPVMLKETEIKKLNNMLPYTMEVSFVMKTDQGLRDVKYIIGVKTVFHPISRLDLAGDLREIVTGNVRSLQRVRYKTGEISLMDYLFNIKGLKDDASKHINHNKRWLNTLKRLGEYERLHGSIFKAPTKFITDGNVPIPNATLILSQPDVSILLNETGIDLTDVSIIKRLAKSLFLITVIIVDKDTSTFRIIHPDDDYPAWDTQSLSAAEAEVSKTDYSTMMRELQLQRR